MSWSDPRGTVDYRGYSRTHEVVAPGRPALSGSADRPFRGAPSGGTRSCCCSRPSPSATCCPTCKPVRPGRRGGDRLPRHRPRHHDPAGAGRSFQRGGAPARRSSSPTPACGAGGTGPARGGARQDCFIAELGELPGAARTDGQRRIGRPGRGPGVSGWSGATGGPPTPPSRPPPTPSSSWCGHDRRRLGPPGPGAPGTCRPWSGHTSRSFLTVTNYLDLPAQTEGDRLRGRLRRAGRFTLAAGNAEAGGRARPASRPEVGPRPGRDRGRAGRGGRRWGQGARRGDPETLLTGRLAAGMRLREAPAHPDLRAGCRRLRHRRRHRDDLRLRRRGRARGSAVALAAEVAVRLDHGTDLLRALTGRGEWPTGFVVVR